MAVAVENGLACCSTDIHADIVTIGVEIFDKDLPAHFDKVEEGEFLFRGQGKKVRGVPVRHEEEVPLADRVPVPAGIAEPVLFNNIVGKRLAERTLCGLLHD